MQPEIATIEVIKMTKLQKLAALLIILGPESAAEILKHLEEDEVESISLEMARMPSISREMQQEILKEFTEVAVHASTAILGGPGYAKNVLEKSIGTSRATEIISRIVPGPTPIPAMQRIIEMDSRQLANILKSEQPQTIALVASYLSPEKCSQLLVDLREDVRDQVVERLATLGPMPIEVVERVVEVLNQRAGVKSTSVITQTGGVKSAADLLNAVEKDLSQSLLSQLDKRNPELGNAIRQKMFTFDDLGLLDNSSLQKIMREVDTRDLAISLKSAPAPLKRTLLSSISRRAAETVNEEISFLGPLKKRDVESARSRIIEMVRKLESDGEIDLGETKNTSRDELLV
jgi:flagellar motor switch protein FliG